MKDPTTRQLTHYFLGYVVALILCQVASGILGFGLVGSSFLYLARYAVLSGGVIMLAALAFGAMHPLTGKWLGISGFLAGILVQVALTSYFLSARVLLGADLFGYTISDIAETVSASAGFSFGSILLWIIPIASFIFIPKILHSVSYNTFFYACLATCGLVSVFVPPGPNPAKYENDFERAKLENASSYFIAKVFFEKTAPLDLSVGPIPEYPFQHAFEPADPLGRYFNTGPDLPNIIIIAVEGLGGDFVGKEAPLRGFTPFLDSLIDHSLYWKNCLSSTGRTFGALPTILGSLPMGQNGFMNLGAQMPNHQTLFSLLKELGYQTSFYYGGNPNFDGQDIFLEAQHSDLVVGEGQFPATYARSEKNEQGFSWGYPDKALFDYSIELIKANHSSLRLDFYMTLTTHEPFQVPEARFEALARKVISSDAINKAEFGTYDEFKNVFECILYTDDAIRSLINKLKTLPGFNNSIIVITGDHRLIPIPSTRIKRFHVPLIVYSPLLKEPKQFGSIAAHSQLPATLLGFLSRNYHIDVPSTTAFLAGPIETSEAFSSTLDLALMRNKNELQEYLFKDYLLSENRLYRINNELTAEPVEDEEMLHFLQQKLGRFKEASAIAINKNRLLSDSIGKSRVNLDLFFTLTPQEQIFITSTAADTLPPDSLLFRAQSLALKKEYFESRALLKKALNTSPNYEDLRILLARTFAWEGAYDSALLHLDHVMTRSVYEDAFIAYADVTYWKADLQKSIEAVKSGLDNFPESIEIKIRYARALLAVEDKAAAKPIIQEVLVENPNHEMALRLKKQLNNL